MHGAMRAVSGEDGRTHMSAHLRFAEYAWSACSFLVLQRLRCAVPLAVPFVDGLLASRHTMLSSKRREAVSGRGGSVLQQDVVLGVCTELLHGCVVGEGREEVCQRREGNGTSQTALTHTFEFGAEE